MAPTAPQLTLRITNVDALPDGEPLYYVSQGQNFAIGRNPAMDWVLPDPNKRISSEHLRVVWHAGRYWLQDVSSNGTFVNGQTTRLPGAHPVENNDRVVIGHYLIAATLTDAPPQMPVKAPPASRNWENDLDRTSVPRPPATVWAEARVVPPAPAPAPAVHTPFSGQQAVTPIAPAYGAADGGARGFMDAICRGAGLPPGSLSGQDHDHLGEELGRCLRIAVEQMISVLAGRAKTKTALGSRKRTMMNAQGNNPMKFVPDTTAALQALFVQRAAYYLPADEAFAEGFEDIKRHEKAVFTSMQQALTRLVEDLSPQSIEARVKGGAFSSRKALAWEMFTERWDAKIHPHENGMLDVFLAYFSDAYDAAEEKER